jgi:two-component system response regulator
MTPVSAKGRPVEILLVEDNYGDVLLTTEAFDSGKLSNHIRVAADGEQALAMLRREGEHADHPRPDLILLDLNLPKVDGREVLAAVKADPDLKHIPVVVLTSSAAETDVVKSYNLHANSYVVKPVNMEKLSEIVATIEAFWFTVVVLAE